MTPVYSEGSAEGGGREEALTAKISAQQGSSKDHQLGKLPSQGLVGSETDVGNGLGLELIFHGGDWDGLRL